MTKCKDGCTGLKGLQCEACERTDEFLKDVSESIKNQNTDSRLFKCEVEPVAYDGLSNSI